MDQLICASLSHTHHRYEMGMLKVGCKVAVQARSHDFPLSALCRPHQCTVKVRANAQVCDLFLNHFKLAFLSHTCAITPTCAIAPTPVRKSNYFFWFCVSSAHPCAITPTCAILSTSQRRHWCFVTLLGHVWLPIPMKNFLIFTCASLPRCNTHSSGAPMKYRETSTQTVAARDVPLDPLGDSTQPHAHKWGLVGAIAPCDSPDSCAKTLLNKFKLAFLSHTCAVTPTCAIAPTCAFARTFTVLRF